MILESTRFGHIHTNLVVLLTHLKITFVSEDTTRPMAYARYVRNTSHAVLILPPLAMARSNMCRPREKIISSHDTHHGSNKPHHPRARRNHNYTLYHTRNPRIQEPCLPTLPLKSPPSRSWLRTSHSRQPRQSRRHSRQLRQPRKFRRNSRQLQPLSSLQNKASIAPRARCRRMRPSQPPMPQPPRNRCRRKHQLSSQRLRRPPSPRYRHTRPSLSPGDPRPPSGHHLQLQYFSSHSWTVADERSYSASKS
jgi:hypothetical protein